MLKTIDINKIYSKQNIRQEADDSIIELADSISQHGLISPLLVKACDNGKYEIIAGHRRYLALKIARIDTVECNVLDDEIDGKDRTLLQLTENIQRKGMSAWELVDVFNELKKKYNMNQRQIAKYLGKSEFYVSQQYTAAKMLDAKYGGAQFIPEEEKKKTASVIQAEHKRKAPDNRVKFFGKGYNATKTGHTYMIYCENFDIEKSLNEWLESYM